MRVCIYLIIILISLSSCRRCADEGLKTNLKYPIVFIPGYGNSAKLWEDKGIIKELKRSYSYGGVLSIDSENDRVKCTPRLTNQKVDFFTIDHSDPVTSIDILSEELARHISFILRYTRAKKVILVGYSMGGVVGRNYVVSSKRNKKVKVLITISSPHQGSYLANLARAWSLVVPPRFHDDFFTKMESWIDYPITTLAINDLIISDQEGSFLHELNQKKHPEEITYHSIIAVSGFTNELLDFAKFIGSLINIESLIYDGDMVVSTKSQNMANIEYIKNSKLETIKLKTTKVNNRNHFNILERKDILIQVLENYIEPTK